jgi:uncharacterized protein (DUF736 family)
MITLPGPPERRITSGNGELTNKWEAWINNLYRYVNIQLTNPTIIGTITEVTAPISSSATAGTNTLPSNPAGFELRIINGTTFKFPYYNV